MEFKSVKLYLATKKKLGIHDENVLPTESTEKFIQIIFLFWE